MPVQSNSGSSATICTQCLDNAFCVKFQNCKTAKSIPGSRFLGLKVLKLVTNPPESPSQLRQTTNDPAILHYLMQTPHAPRPARFPPRNPTKSAQRWTKRWTHKEVGHHTTKSAQWWTKRWTPKEVGHHTTKSAQRWTSNFIKLLVYTNTFKYFNYIHMQRAFPRYCSDASSELRKGGKLTNTRWPIVF